MEVVCVQSRWKDSLISCWDIGRVDILANLPAFHTLAIGDGMKYVGIKWCDT